MRVSDYLRQLRDAPYVKHTLEDDSYATVAKALGLEHADWVEGWFWPDTDVHRQHQRYRHPQARASENGRRSGEGLGRTDGESAYADQNQLLTMASIIEKDRGSEERDRVASVLSTACASVCACRPIRP